MQEVTQQAALIALSPAAAGKLLDIMAEKGLRETHGLRVFVQGGGCSGLQYGMSFDDSQQDIDLVFEQHGLRVMVDPRSAPYISGAWIDFQDGPMGSGFQIENPNLAAGCNCGSSSESGCCGEDGGEEGEGSCSGACAGCH